MDLGLKGRNVIVTGASMGIGRVIALTFAAEGANVGLLARSRDKLEEVAAEITDQYGVKAIALPADITDRKSVDAAINTAVSEFGTIHVLVNNAGHRMSRLDRQLEWEDEDWLKDINSKVVGLLRVIRALDPHFAMDGSGAIINVVGFAGTEVLGGALTHGINNPAIIQITGYLARDLAGKKIRVNSVSPGLVASEWRRDWAKTMAEKKGTTVEGFLADYMKSIGAYSNTWALVEQVADVVVYVASSRASYINGAFIPVDAGITTNPR